MNPYQADTYADNARQWDAAYRAAWHEYRDAYAAGAKAMPGVWGLRIRVRDVPAPTIDGRVPSRAHVVALWDDALAAASWYSGLDMACRGTRAKLAALDRFHDAAARLARVIDTDPARWQG